MDSLGPGKPAENQKLCTYLDAVATHAREEPLTGVPDDPAAILYPPAAGDSTRPRPAPTPGVRGEAVRVIACARCLAPGSGRSRAGPASAAGTGRPGRPPRGII